MATYEMGAIDAVETERLDSVPILLRLEGFLGRRSRGFVLLLGLLLLALIGVVDAVTGSFDVSFFYLVPVALVTFSRGPWMGTLMAGVATAARAAAEVARGAETIDSPVLYWSTLSRFYVFMGVVLLIAPMRAALVSQRELAQKEHEVAEREREAAEQLRALNELRDALQHETVPEESPFAALLGAASPAADLDVEPG